MTKIGKISDLVCDLKLQMVSCKLPLPDGIKYRTKVHVKQLNLLHVHIVYSVLVISWIMQPEIRIISN